MVKWLWYWAVIGQLFVGNKLHQSLQLHKIIINTVLLKYLSRYILYGHAASEMGLLSEQLTNNKCDCDSHGYNMRRSKSEKWRVNKNELFATASE